MNCGAPVSLARNSAAESESGQKFIPPNPLSFCPPERFGSCRAAGAASFRILFKKGSSGVQ
jgi:hypothetical protein